MYKKIATTLCLSLYFLHGSQADVSSTEKSRGRGQGNFSLSEILRAKKDSSAKTTVFSPEVTAFFSQLNYSSDEDQPSVPVKDTTQAMTPAEQYLYHVLAQHMDKGFAQINKKLTQMDQKLDNMGDENRMVCGVKFIQPRKL